MGSIANLLVSLKTDFGSSDSALDSLISKLSQVGQEADKTGEKVHDTGSKVEEAGHEAEEGGEGFEKLIETFSDLGGEIVAFGLEALALTSIFEALKESLEVSAQLESTRVALEALTGSAEKATEVIENMEKIASSEGLSFAELLPAAQHIAAFGFTVEQTTDIMKTAGNVAIATGSSIESVSQRIAMIAESGRVSNLFLRTLKLTTEDLGKVMGISAGEVSKAFQVLSQSTQGRADAIEIITKALEKFGDVGAKNADTVVGKWNELKNAWHEAFLGMGEDLEDITKGLETFVTWIGKTVSGVEKGIALTVKSIKEHSVDLTGLSGSPGEYLTAAQLEENKKQQENKKQPPETTEKSEEKKKTESSVDTELQGRVKDDLGQERAKEYAATQLAIIKGAQETNKSLAQLNREKTEAAINENHLLRQAELEGIEDSNAKELIAAHEAVSIAEEKRDKIGAIDAEEARRKKALIQPRLSAQIAQTYSVKDDEHARSSKILTLTQDAKNDIKAIDDELALKVQKAEKAVSEAKAKEVVTQAKVGAGSIKTEREVASSKIESDADIKAIGYQEQKIKLEGEYDAVLSHTFAQQIDHLNAVAEKERKGRESHIEGLQGQLVAIPSDVKDNKATEERAKLENQISKAKAENAKADAESANQLIKAGQEYQKALREAAEIKTKSDADIQAEKIGQDKIKLEAQYAAQLSHTNEQEISHLTQVAAIEEAQRQTKIQGLQTELAKVPQGDNPEFIKQRASIEAEIADQQEKSSTAALQSAIQITQQMEAQNKLLAARKELAQAVTDWAKIGLGDVAKDFADELVKVPQGIGQAIATGLFDKEKGRDMGQVMAKAIVDSLKQEGKNLVGNLATQGIEKLISTILGQDVFASAQVKATAANTTQIGVLIAAIKDLSTKIGQTPIAQTATPPKLINPSATTTAPVAHGDDITILNASLLALLNALQQNNLNTLANTSAVTSNTAAQLTPKTPIGIGGKVPGGAIDTNIDFGEGKQNLGTTVTPGSGGGGGGLSNLFKLFSPPSPNQGSGTSTQGLGQLLPGLLGNTAALLGATQGTKEHGALVTILHAATIANTGATLANTIATILETYVPKPFGFAAGGDPDPNKPFIAGEKGPELINPKGKAFTVYPRDSTKSLLEGVNLPPKGTNDIQQHGNALDTLEPNTSNTFSTSTSNHQSSSVVGDTHFHIYGARDPRETMRQIAAYQKLQTGKFSPANS